EGPPTSETEPGTGPFERARRRCSRPARGNIVGGARRADRAPSARRAPPGRSDERSGQSWHWAWLRWRVFFIASTCFLVATFVGLFGSQLPRLGPCHMTAGVTPGPRTVRR